MNRTAKPSLVPPLPDQLCPPRPAVVLQHHYLTQVNVELPDRIRFFYPDANGRQAQYQLEVHVLGENAHGVNFLTGICQSTNKMRLEDSGASENGAPPVFDAFRMDLISGLITRMQNGERMTLQDWEKRVRRCFAMDCKSDALPLSSMLISANSKPPDAAD